MTDTDEQLTGRLAKVAPTALWIGLLAVLAAAPALNCLLPAFSLSHSVAYLLRLPAQPTGSRHRRNAFVAARTRLRRSRALSAVALVLSLVVATLGPAGVIGAAVIAGSWHFVWMSSLRLLNEDLERAGVPRIAGPRSRIREAAHAAGVEGTFLRPLGSAHVAPLHQSLLGLLVLGMTLAGSGLQPQAVTSVVAGTVEYFRGASGGVTPAPQSPTTASPAPVTQHLSAVNTPTALPQSPCPDLGQVARRFAQDVPVEAARALYAAWFSVGGAVIGCPERPPVRRGHVLIAELNGGQDTPAAVVFGAGQAGIVLSDMHAIVSAVVDRLSWVEPRLRWGLGTQQLLHMQGGSCQLAQRYGQDAPTLLPAAVTRLLLDVSARTGAVPRVIRETVVPRGRTFKVLLLQADSQNEIRSIDAVTVSYAAGAAVVVDTRERATDTQRCPASALRLPVVSAMLEDAVQRR